MNAMAKGTARVTGLSKGQDVVATRRCLENLGVKIDSLDGPGEVVVHGREGELSESSVILDAANSGTTMRLMSGLLASQPFLSVLTGDDSLRSRPMGRVVQPLSQMGALIMGRKGDTLAPLAIRGGGLRGIEYKMPVASAQVKSCIILAALRASGETVLHQPALSRDHTERMLEAMGAPVVEDGLTLTVRPGKLKAVNVNVPGDISAAAFWMVAASCHPDAQLRLLNVGMNPGRTGILEVMRSMGARVRAENERLEGGEPVADLVVEPSRLEATEVGGDVIPRVLDEIPVLAVAACFAKGTTVIKDAEELRVKESDRIKTTVQELSRMGASIEERADGMVIRGTGSLKGGLGRSYGDHRLAMALGVVGLIGSGEVTVEDSESASVSYPEFWEHLNSVIKN
jgi:3-phosphoshikimate 1-carboxyvinyltransferase